MAATPVYGLPYPSVTDDPNVPADIQALAEEVETEIVRVDAAIATKAPLSLVVVKAADESVTSSTALQNDDHLLLAMEASATYLFDGYIVYQGAADPAGGLKIDWTIPAGAGMVWTSFGTNYNGGLTQYDATVQTNATVRNYPTNAGQQMALQPKGRLVTAGTAGNLQMRWAQVVSNATATIIKAGSYIRLTKVG